MDTDLKNVIKQLKKFPTSFISDSMDAYGLKYGWLNGLTQLTTKMDETAVGRVKIIQEAPNLCKDIKPPNFYEIIRECQDETILLLGGSGSDSALMGDNYAMAAKVEGFKAIIVDGLVRDSPVLDEVGISVYSLGCEGHRGGGSIVAYDVPIMFRNRWIHPGDIVAADGDGAIVFPANKASDILRHAQTIAQLEVELGDIIERQGSISDLGDILQKKNNLVRE